MEFFGYSVKNKTSKVILDSYFENGNVITDKIEIVNKFNDYFLSVETNLARKMTPTSVDILKFLKQNF